MSNKAMTWATQRHGLKSSVKFVLVAMADLADNNGICFPSIKYIETVTEQDRKTVISAIKTLKESGFIYDTGQRTGKTKQVPFYRLDLEKPPYFSVDNFNGSKNGTVSDGLENDIQTKDLLEQYQKRNSSVFPSKEYQKRDTEPSIPYLSLSEENFQPVDNFTPTPQGQVCVEWVKLGIRCNPSNPTLLEALKAGITPEELIETAKEIVGNVQNPSMNYIIKAVIGRRSDAAKLAQSLKDNPLPNKPLDFKKAYDEAVEQSRIRYESGKDVWSSPEIFHAAKRLGGDLQRLPWQEIKVRWAEALDWALEGVKSGRLGTSIPRPSEPSQGTPKAQQSASPCVGDTYKKHGGANGQTKSGIKNGLDLLEKFKKKP